MTKLNYGHAYFRFGDKREQTDLNVGPSSDTRRMFYNAYVASGRTIEAGIDGCTPRIGRFSKLRYFKEDLPILSSQLNGGFSNAGVTPSWVTGDDNRQGYQVYQDHRTGEIVPATGGVNSPPGLDDVVFGTPIDMLLAESSFAVGAVYVRWANEGGAVSNDVPPPAGNFGTPVTSFIDLPGTVIGNKFKHPVARNSLFNEVGQIATSQGNMAVLGVFNPPENLAYHTAYQVYFTKSGGTGEPVQSTKTGGTLSSNELTDSVYSFVAGDVGKAVALVDSATAGNNRTLRIGAVAAGLAMLCDGYGAITWSTVATMTTTAAHGLTTGDSVTIDTSTGYDGTYTITVTGANTFTFAHADAGADSGTWVLDLADDAVAFDWELRSNGLGDTGQVVDANEFSDDYYAFQAGATPAGDVGRYIAINTANNTIITEILSVAGGVATVDADIINEDLAADTDIYWELRDGPIAEYFVRKRRYRKFDLWSDTISGVSDTFNTRSFNIYNRAMTVLSNAHGRPGVTMLHDRGSCWWGISLTLATDAYAPYCLYRQMDDGPYPLDYPYADGDITGGMPAGITAWRHMDIDKNDKLWITADDTAPAVGASVFRIDPYPLGESLEPDLLNSLTKQASLAAAGLPSLAAMGVVCDNVNGDGTHGRTWIVCGDDGAINGGLYYTEDGGSTMKGLVHEKSALTLGGTDSWDVEADGETVNYSGTGAPTLNTELVAGEWITFNDGAKDESKRQIASITDADTLVLTTATKFPGVVAGLTMKKGAIETVHIGLRFFDAVGQWNATEILGPPGVDHDSSGRLYWCPFDYNEGIVRFDPDTTDPVALLSITDVGVGLGTAFSGIQHVLVSRMPDPLAFGDSIWHDNVWIGGRGTEGSSRIYGWETYVNTGVATDVGAGTDEFSDAGRAFTAADIGKYIKIYKSASGNDGYYEITSINGSAAVCSSATFTTESNICWELYGVTRYYGAAADNFPTTAQYSPNAQTTFYNNVTIMDRVNGDIFFVPSGINGLYNNGTRATRVLTHLQPTDPEFGTTVSETGDLQLQGTYGRSSIQALKFDDLGMGTMWTSGFNENHSHTTSVQGYHVNPHWSCLLWDGSAWVQAPFNGIDADLDFDASGEGPLGENTLALGQGLRRVFDQPQELEHDQWLQFNQAGGATAQADEYVVDENVTWVDAIGRIKDNTMTAEYLGTAFKIPTVTRINEVAGEIGSPWTMIGGWDGGFVDAASDQAFPAHLRGIAEGEETNKSGINDPYPNLNHVANAVTDPHYMCHLRIHDEEVHAAGAGTGLDIFNDAGDGKATDSAGANFVTADIGKTIRVEGAATGGNNTAKVITNLVGASPSDTVILDSQWAAAENDRAWRVRNIPEVSHVVLGFWMDERILLQDDFTLLSSRDGVTWDIVKEAAACSGASSGDLVSTYRDPGIYMGGNYFFPLSRDYQLNGENDRCYIMFDLTGAEMTSDQRRRTYWKVVRNNVNAGAGACYPMSMLLLDSNYAPVLASNLMPADRTDPLFFGMRPKIRAIVHESAGVVSIGQSTTMPFGYGDIVNEAGGNYWLQNNIDLKTYANTSKVTSALATFTWQDVGRKLRVPAADITLGVDETYSGFLTIVSVQSANEVTVERTFESQASGAIDSVTSDTGARFDTIIAHGMVVGDAVTISGTTSYNGSYIVTAVDTNWFKVGLSWVADETGAWNKGQKDLTWASLNFGATDRVRFEDTTTIFAHIGRPLAVVSFEIVDVPSDTQIQVANMEIPDTITADFEVEREFEKVFNSAWTDSMDLESGFNAFYNPKLGIFGVADEAQFNYIDGDTARSAASEVADSDGDGWSDAITITGTEVTDAAVDDWLLLYSPNTEADDDYRRWYKIKTVSTGGGDTTITTYEDEIRVNETFKWKIARKRDMKMRLISVIVSAREPI
jgi:hypothetical protein